MSPGRHFKTFKPGGRFELTFKPTLGLCPCFVRVGLVLNDGLVLAVPACQYITTYLPSCAWCPDAVYSMNWSYSGASALMSHVGRSPWRGAGGRTTRATAIAEKSGIAIIAS